MKKVLAIALVAILVASSAFATFSGSASVSAGYNFETGDYGFLSNDSSFDLNVDLSTASAEAIADGDVYASIKASLAVKVVDGDDKTSDFDTIIIDGTVAKLAFVASLDEAKVAGNNWYVSIKGVPSVTDFAKSFTTKTIKNDKDDFGFALDDYKEAITYKVGYDKAPGVEVGYADYVFGAGFKGNKDGGFAFTGFAKTPEYDFDGFILQAGAVASKKQNTGVTNGGLSAKVGYKTDLLNVSLASDFGLALAKAGNEYEATPDADVALNVTYDFLTADAYYATNVETAKNGDVSTTTKNYLAAQVVTDLNGFNVPVKLTLTGKDLVNTQDLSAKVEATVAEGVKVRANGGYVIDSTKVSVGAGATYETDLFKVEGDVGYNVKVNTDNTNVLTLSASIESSALIPGATLKLAYSEADEDMNLLKDQETPQNLGKIVASCKIEF